MASCGQADLKDTQMATLRIAQLLREGNNFQNGEEIKRI
jgi:hypothetical protein